MITYFDIHNGCRRYLNLDAGVWLPNRTATGDLQADPDKFPSGLNSLSTWLRDMGITLGLYTDLSSRAVGKVCGTGPGSYGFYHQDAATIAAVAGFVKVDYVRRPTTFACSLSDVPLTRSVRPGLSVRMIKKIRLDSSHQSLSK